MALCKSSGFAKIFKKAFSTSSMRGYPVEVMVSQSSDLMANTALEEWIRRNGSFKHKNFLLLSSNQVKSGRNIKAFFIGECGSLNHHDAKGLMEQASIVINALPEGAALSSLPRVNVKDEDGSVLISVPLENPAESTVQNALQNIAEHILESGDDVISSKISLVRPDGDWFPGIQAIQEDLEHSLTEIQAIQLDKQRYKARPQPPPCQNSYGSHF